MRTIANGVFAAKMSENTEEFQALCGWKKLSHNLEVAGSNPVPATFWPDHDPAFFMRFRQPVVGTITNGRNPVGSL